jgi:hypothetical protein
MTESLEMYKNILIIIAVSVVLGLYFYINLKEKKEEGNKVTLFPIINQTLDFTIILFISFISIILFFLPIPNILGISNANNVSDILNVTITALASILGIIIAVTLVAFEILRTTYNSYAFNTFFKNKNLKRLISIYLMSITVSYINMTSISNNLTDLNIKYTYLSLSLFLVSLFILFPVLFSIITSTQSKKKIKEIISQIDDEIVNSFHWNGTSPIIYVNNVGEDPITILMESGVSSLKNNDSYLPMFILDELITKIFEILNHQNLQEKNIVKKYINIYLLVLRPVTDQAIILNDLDTLSIAIDTTKDIYTFCTMNKIKMNEINSLDEFLKDLTKKTVKYGIDPISQKVIRLFSKIMKENLEKNIPPENEIFSLEFEKGNVLKNADHDKEAQWHHFAYQYVNYIRFLSKDAIKYKRAEVLKTASYTLDNMANYILDSSLSKTQKHSIIQNCIHILEQIIVDSIRADLNSTTLVLNPFFMRNDLEKDKEIAKMKLLTLSEMLIELDAKDLYESITLMHLGSLGRICASKIDEDDIYKETLIFIVDIFDKLRENAEKRKSEIAYLYLNFYDYLKSFKKQMTKEGIKNDKIENYINNALNRFKPLKSKADSLKVKTLLWKSYNDL